MRPCCRYRVLPALCIGLLVTACIGGGGGGGNNGGGNIDEAHISGALTFDLVPHAASLNSARAGLDYANTRRHPIRGVLVQAVGAVNAATGQAPVLASNISDAAGRYRLAVPPDTAVRIRVMAHLVTNSGDGPRWDVQVRDNTNGNALYTLQGSLAKAARGRSSRNLHAGSGWDAEKPAPASSTDRTAGGYRSSARIAAPFAILSTVYDALQKLGEVDADMNLAPLTYYWSINNRSTSSINLTTGAIGSPFYDRAGTIYLRGKENANTDEYDRHIVLHELAHHLQEHLSRDDSPGGAWSSNYRLDMRLAFSEGFAIALGGIVTGDPIERDSYGPRQVQGAVRNIETNPVYSDSAAVPYRTGWYDAGSVASILYDLYDASDDGADRISLGLAPIYAALTSPGFKDSLRFTGIHSFAQQLRRQLRQLPNRALLESGLSALLRAQRIFGNNARGQGETNNGGIEAALPLYHRLSATNPSINNVCSFGSLTPYHLNNRLGNRVFVELDFDTSARYTLKMTKTSGSTGSRPELFMPAELTIHRQLIYEISEKVRVNTAAEESTSISANFDFRSGPLAIEAFDSRNVRQISVKANDTTCFELSISRSE